MELMLPETTQSHLKNNGSPLSLKWDKQPKYVWNYVWGADEHSYIWTALFSELAHPVPHPPPNELVNQVALATINSHPHLFHITTPTDVERLHTLLMSHPNCALVESVCRGLREGF